MKNLFYSSLVLALITMLLFSLSCKKDEDDVNNEKTALVVPVDFGSIQAAIDASSDGDTIFVQEGTYKENITFKGKKILVQSLAPENSDIVNNTVIDGNGQGTVVTFNSGETEASILNGFKIINGDAGTSDGGGIIITNASTPVIKNNVISNNTAKYGGGILVSGEANPLIQNNIFESNISESSREQLFM
ncbi:MAG: hypothetical protein U5L09_21175 [Bacteroidales bacterium]|nr:hypothetical protein [Bacteroidales bacterium]